MKDKLKIGLGIALSLFPLYSFITWLYIYSTHKYLDHSNRVIKYLELFPDFLHNAQIIGVISISLALISLILIGNSNHLKTLGSVAKITYMAFLALILIFNVWSLL
ncbi:hypothetical protein H8S95_03630 [Pontibacter sp. KCTC 32443]|uniref:hypothetical protein n=1 Tax=Pontibacter TaxID=323449 RepID=UPI00164D9E75|nr:MULTISPECIES: hypothetical protein [Pontibacter]MBC5773143.1 hypothetical protein [Pontibacter sp. KCTC 32443]